MHIADVMGMQGGAEEQIPGEERGAANAAHVLRARRHLRHLVPFPLDAGAKTAVQKALKELNDWAREYWGPELVEIVEDDDENDTGAARTSSTTTTAAGNGGAARTSCTGTTAAASGS